MTAPPATASFDPAADGTRFTLRYEPPADVPRAGTVILAPAFAEEMNRCRRMTALCSRALVRSGWRVIVRDLRGCGDSSGDFGDATWKDWIDDLKPLLAEAPAHEEFWLWGVRAGALLLTELLAERPDANALLWQPAIAGRVALNQFLRVKVASAAIGGKNRVDAKGLRADLEAGQSIEIAGYTINHALAAGMDSAILEVPPTFQGRVVWLEVAAIDPPSLAPAGAQLRDQWASRGVRFDAEVVAGEAFWQTQETSECEALLAATLRHMEGDRAIAAVQAGSAGDASHVALRAGLPRVEGA